MIIDEHNILATDTIRHGYSEAGLPTLPRESGMTSRNVPSRGDGRRQCRALFGDVLIFRSENRPVSLRAGTGRAHLSLICRRRRSSFPLRRSTSQFTDTPFSGTWAFGGGTLQGVANAIRPLAWHQPHSPPRPRKQQRSQPAAPSSSAPQGLSNALRAGPDAGPN